MASTHWNMDEHPDQPLRCRLTREGMEQAFDDALEQERAAERLSLRSLENESGKDGEPPGGWTQLQGLSHP